MKNIEQLVNINSGGILGVVRATAACLRRLGPVVDREDVRGIQNHQRVSQRPLKQVGWAAAKIPRVAFKNFLSVPLQTVFNARQLRC